MKTKQYLLFGWDKARGGADDFIESFDSWDRLQNYVNRDSNKRNTFNVLELPSGEICLVEPA